MALGRQGIAASARPVIRQGCRLPCRDCNLFQLCLPVNGGRADRALLDRIIRRPRTLKRGEVLFAPGEPFRNIYAVRSGSLKTFVSRERGGECVTGFYLPGELLGLDAIDGGLHHTGARALDTASVCEVPLDRLEELGMVENQIQRQMLRVMSRQLRHNFVQRAVLSGTRAEQRLAAFIVNLSGRFEQRGFSAVEFRMSMPRHDIASYLGLTKETVCRILARFQERGYVDLDRRHFRIRNLSVLRTLASAPVEYPARDRRRTSLKMVI
jgi:CRP/FNR family transcriptional regulator